MTTRRPRSLSRRPSELAVSPLPSELATPPVTKMCFGIGETSVLVDFGADRRTARREITIPRCSRRATEDKPSDACRHPRSAVNPPRRVGDRASPLDLCAARGSTIEQLASVLEGGRAVVAGEHARDLGHTLLSVD